MDWESYAKELEGIIEAASMHPHTRILVDALVKRAKEKALKKPTVSEGIGEPVT